MPDELRIGIDGTDFAAIAASPGDTLLDALAETGICLPAACGGLGSCGQCKIAISSGAPDYSPLESPWIAPSERGAGVHLACQVRMRKDLTVKVEPALQGAAAREAVLVGIATLAPEILKLTLELPEGKAMTTRPGQFVQVSLPSERSGERRQRREYSIASAPGTSRRFEIEVQRVPHGLFSSYLTEQLSIGGRLRFSGPFGGFTAFESSRDLVCAATGSGMAPIRSILLGTAASGRRRRISYFFAAPRVSEIPHLDEMRALERELEGFRFIPVLEDVEPGIKRGPSRSIASALEAYVARDSDTEACVCGNTRFVEACARVLSEKGVRPEAIHYDRFSASGGWTR